LPAAHHGARGFQLDSQQAILAVDGWGNGNIMDSLFGRGYQQHRALDAAVREKKEENSFFSNSFFLILQQFCTRILPGNFLFSSFVYYVR